jgi:type IX secretion system PorP/SprF family membrane protein
VELFRFYLVSINFFIYLHQIIKNNIFLYHMNKVFLSFLLLFCAVQSQAQDILFSQFFASPLNMNPALTGAFNGKYRVSMVYRDQWRGVTNNSPFQTYSAAIDLRFNVNEKKVQKDVASAGMVFTTDKASTFGFNSNQILVSGAYSKSLDVENKQYLTIGLQGGLAQRNLNFDNLYFDDMYNGSTFTGTTAEIYPGNNIAYPDLSTGINYSVSPSRNRYYAIGLAAHHLFTPNVAFFDATTAGGTKQLDRKYTLHASGQMPLNFKNTFSPRLYITSQGSHAQATLGGNFRMQFTDYGTTALHLGTWVRGVRNTKGLGFDSAALMVGYELSNFLLGLSYDLNLKGLGAYGRNQSILEVSLGYLGDYDNDTILCPKF